MPACVVWTLRWYPHRSTRLNFDAKSVEAKERWHHGSLLDLVVLPVLPYLLWAVAYYIKVLLDRWTRLPDRIPHVAVHEQYGALDRTARGRLSRVHLVNQRRYELTAQLPRQAVTVCEALNTQGPRI